MKDLYKVLGVEPHSGAEEIKAALEQKPDLAEYSAILLNEDRRDEYDGARHTLKIIGTLRGRLGLDTGHSWFVENYPDFSLRQGPAFAPPPRPEPRKNDRTTASPAPRASARPGRSNSNHLWIFGLIGLAAVLLVVAYFLL